MENKDSELLRWSKYGTANPGSGLDSYQQGLFEGALHLLEVLEEYLTEAKRVLAQPDNSIYIDGIQSVVEELKEYCGKV